MRIHTVTILSAALAMLLLPVADAEASNGPATYLPVPYLPGRTVEFRSHGVDLAGTFMTEDGACHISLTASTAGTTPAQVAVPAGTKRQLAFEGLTVEAFCCPELRMMTLRAVRPAATLPSN